MSNNTAATLSFHAKLRSGSNGRSPGNESWKRNAAVIHRAVPVQYSFTEEDLDGLADPDSGLNPNTDTNGRSSSSYMRWQAASRLQDQVDRANGGISRQLTKTRKIFRKLHQKDKMEIWECDSSEVQTDGAEQDIEDEPELTKRDLLAQFGIKRQSLRAEELFEKTNNLQDVESSWRFDQKKKGSTPEINGSNILEIPSVVPVAATPQGFEIEHSQSRRMAKSPQGNLSVHEKHPLEGFASAGNSKRPSHQIVINSNHEVERRAYTPVRPNSRRRSSASSSHRNHRVPSNSAISRALSPTESQNTSPMPSPQASHQTSPPISRLTSPRYSLTSHHTPGQKLKRNRQQMKPAEVMALHPPCWSLLPSLELHGYLVESIVLVRGENHQSQSRHASDSAATPQSKKSSTAALCQLLHLKNVRAPPTDKEDPVTEVLHTTICEEITEQGGALLDVAEAVYWRWAKLQKQESNFLVGEEDQRQAKPIALFKTYAPGQKAKAKTDDGSVKSAKEPLREVTAIHTLAEFQGAIQEMSDPKNKYTEACLQRHTVQTATNPTFLRCVWWEGLDSSARTSSMRYLASDPTPCFRPYRLTSQYPKTTGLAAHLSPVLAPPQMYEMKALPVEVVDRRAKVGMSKLIAGFIYLGIKRVFVDWSEDPAGVWSIVEIHGVQDASRSNKNPKDKVSPHPKSLKSNPGAQHKKGLHLGPTDSTKYDGIKTSRASGKGKSKPTVIVPRLTFQKSQPKKQVVLTKTENSVHEAPSQNQQLDDSKGLRLGKMMEYAHKGPPPRTSRTRRFRCAGDFCDSSGEEPLTKRIIPSAVIRRCRLKLQGFLPPNNKVFFMEKAVKVCEACYKQYNIYEKDERENFREQMAQKRKDDEQARRLEILQRPKGWKSRIQVEYETSLQDDRLRLQQILRRKLEEASLYHEGLMESTRSKR